MKQYKSIKLTIILVILALITSAFVSGTLARYITATSNEDSARVAIWGINADDVEMNLFDSEYDLNGNKVAKSWNGDKIIAPGTNMASKFSIVNLDDTLAPEVMYEIKVDVDDTEIDQRILDNPSIQWKLDNNAWGTWADTKADILALSGDASGVKTYQALEIADEFADGKEHTIAWQWMLDDNNTQDTTMGNQAVTEDLIAKISVKVTARQVQEDSTTLIYNINDPHVLTFKTDEDFNLFKSVKVDGATINSNNYETEEGSIIVKLKKEYLQNLSIGFHTLTIITDNNETTFNFNVSNSLAIAHNNIIPEGGIYHHIPKDFEIMETLGIKFPTGYYENIYRAGDTFPNNPHLGDLYYYNNYVYMYGGHFDENWSDLVLYIEETPGPTDASWAVISQLLTSSDTPGNMVSEIANKPVTDISHLFWHDLYIIAPPPIISQYATNMEKAFYSCSEMRTAPQIPNSILYMGEAFAGCYNLTGSIEINANPIDYIGALKYTNITEVIGSTTLKEEILATK